jgi:hypothetical protein
MGLLASRPASAKDGVQTLMSAVKDGVSPAEFRQLLQRTSDSCGEAPLQIPATVSLIQFMSAFRSPFPDKNAYYREIATVAGAFVVSPDVVSDLVPFMCGFLDAKSTTAFVREHPQVLQGSFGGNGRRPHSLLHSACDDRYGVSVEALRAACVAAAATPCDDPAAFGRTCIDARDSLGMTPLHWACFRGNVAAAKLLLQHGADVLLTRPSRLEAERRVPLPTCVYLALASGVGIHKKLELLRLMFGHAGQELVLSAPQPATTEAGAGVDGEGVGAAPMVSATAAARVGGTDVGEMTGVPVSEMTGAQYRRYMQAALETANAAAARWASSITADETTRIQPLQEEARWRSFIGCCRAQLEAAPAQQLAEYWNTVETAGATSGAVANSGSVPAGGALEAGAGAPALARDADVENGRARAVAQFARDLSTAIVQGLRASAKRRRMHMAACFSRAASTALATRNLSLGA